MNAKTKKAIQQLKKIEKIVKGKEPRLSAEWHEDWKVLISTILSSQTKD
jgi:endonuclease III